MQARTKIIYRCLAIIAGFLLLPLLIHATTFAENNNGQFSNGQYGSNAYGSNAYGGSGNTPNQTSNASKTNNGGSAPKNNGTLDRVISTIVSPAVLIANKYQAVIGRLSVSQQRVIPMVLWYLLAIMALILLVEAYIKRRESQKLAKTVAHLKETAQEQKNFSRLVLHNLNTPLAIIKNLIEMLVTNVNEAHAAQALQEPTLGLSSTIEYATHVASEDRELITQSSSLPKSNISLGSILRKWYFFVPVVLATIFGLLTGVVLYRLGTGRSATYIAFQLITSVVIIIIFGNALRIFAISRYQHQTLQTLRRSIEILNIKRGRVLTSLNSSLGTIVEKLKTGSKTVHDTKISSLLNEALGKLSELSYKVKAADEPLSKTIENCDVPAIVTQLVTKYKPTMDKKQLQINTDYRINKTVVTHLPELQLMIDTLLKNAIDYSKEGGTINVSAKIVKSKLRLQIQDSGTGMSQQAQAELFKPFSSTEDVTTAAQQSFGLSLYVCKNVVTRMGGKIDIDSAIGKGTTAGIVIPLAS